MDTRLCDGVHALAEGCDLLVIESTFLDEDSRLAADHGHLTAGQAARVAKEAGVRHLVLTHFSQRYPDPGRFERQARAAGFEGELTVAQDLIRVPVPSTPGGTRSIENSSCHLPKAELHLHIEGTLEPELAFALAARNGVQLPYADTDELRTAYLFDDLQTFLDLYYELMAVLRTEEDFADLADAYLARAAAQGVGTRRSSSTRRRTPPAASPIGTVIEGLRAARWTQRGVARHLHPADHVLPARRVRRVRDGDARGREAVPATGSSAVGLDSAEVGHPPVEVPRGVRAAARRARPAHASPTPARRARPRTSGEALDVLGVERIDHGAALHGGPRSSSTGWSRERIPLTLCPLSNVRLRAVDVLEDHPLRAMMDAGLLVHGELRRPGLLRRIRRRQLPGGARGARPGRASGCGSLARNSFEAAFLDHDEERRARYLAEVEAYEFD